MPKSTWRENLTSKEFKEKIRKNSKKRADFYSTIKRIAKERLNDIHLILNSLEEERLDEIMLDPNVFPTVRDLSRAFYFAHRRKKDKEKEERRAIHEILRTKIRPLKEFPGIK